MKGFITRIGEALTLGRLEFYTLVTFMIMCRWLVGVYANSRSANPVCIDFKVQNQGEVAYEQSKMMQQFEQLEFVKENGGE